MRFPNAVFRERYELLNEKEGLTLADVALRLDWETKDKDGEMKPDSTRVARTLGIAKENRKLRDSVSHDVAKSLCRALHIDPVDISL